MLTHVDRARARFAAGVVAFALLAMLAGCSTLTALKNKLPFVSHKPPATAAKLHYAGYPTGLPLGNPIDIEVVRTRGSISLINRSVYPYGQAQLWLNHDYGARISEIPIGRSGPIALANFHNGFGDPYPVGTVLRPEIDRSLLMADLIFDGQIHKLTVRLADDWRKTAK